MYKSPLDILGLGREAVLRCKDNPEGLLKVAEGLRKSQATLFHPDIYSEDSHVMRAINAAVSDLKTMYEEDRLEACITSYLEHQQTVRALSEFLPGSEEELQERDRRITDLERTVKALRLSAGSLAEDIVRFFRGDLTENTNHIVSFSGVVTTAPFEGKENLFSSVLYVSHGAIVRQLTVQGKRKERSHHNSEVRRVATRLYEKPLAIFRARAVTEVRPSFGLLGSIELEVASRLAKYPPTSCLVLKARVREKRAIKTLRADIVPEIRKESHLIGADSPFITTESGLRHYQFASLRGKVDMIVRE